MGASRLHVFFETIENLSISKNDQVLFLSNDYSKPVKNKIKKFYNGARESISIREKAISDYIDLTVRIGNAKLDDKTFREALIVEKSTASTWWYHLTSSRDNTSDSVYEDILLIYTIDKVFKESQCDSLILYDFPERLIKVLSSKWKSSSIIRKKRIDSFLKLFARALLSRLKYAYLTSKKIFVTRQFIENKKRAFDVIYFGFWDWSVMLDSDRNIIDKYHKRLPSYLSENTELSQAWLVMFDPHSEPGSENRKMKEVIPENIRGKNIFFLQNFMSYFDLFKEFIRISPFLTYLRYHNLISSGLSSQGFDLSYLFKDKLIYSFLNSSIPHLRLIETATKRACEYLNPLSTVSFLETYPFSRACFAGVNNYNALVPNIAIQHASRNEESLFFLTDPSQDGVFIDEPSGLPKADYLFAMGRAGMELALKSGYSAHKVKLTGSPRFDHVIRKKKEFSKKKRISVLFAASGVTGVELPAFLMALKVIKLIPNIDLILREHFFWKISKFNELKNFKDDYELSNLTLDQDLERADLVLFTTTTLAEEALMRSIPVWQISSIKSNLSSLSDIEQVKKFFSQDELYNALKNATTLSLVSKNEFNLAFLDNIEDRCFYRCDGLASSRVARQIRQILNKL